MEFEGLADKGGNCKLLQRTLSERLMREGSNLLFEHEGVDVLDAKAIVGYLISMILFVLGVLYALASVYEPIRLITSAFLFLVGFGVLYYIRKSPPLEIRQTIAVTGPVKVKEVRCPVCNAVVDPTKAEVIAGKPYVTCSYCKNKFELTEEPTW